jgi:uncharacterized protein (DUF736 family)
MIIGNFDYDSNEDTFQGNLMTLIVQYYGICFRPVEKSGDKEPDYRVIAKTEQGLVEFGAAWKRTSERGQEFLSVSLDDPSFSARRSTPRCFPTKVGRRRSSSGIGRSRRQLRPPRQATASRKKPKRPRPSVTSGTGRFGGRCFFALANQSAFAGSVSCLSGRK